MRGAEAARHGQCRNVHVDLRLHGEKQRTLVCLVRNSLEARRDARPMTFPSVSGGREETAATRDPTDRLIHNTKCEAASISLLSLHPHFLSLPFGPTRSKTGRTGPPPILLRFTDRPTDRSTGSHRMHFRRTCSIILAPLPCSCRPPLTPHLSSCLILL